MKPFLFLSVLILLALPGPLISLQPPPSGNLSPTVSVSLPGQASTLNLVEGFSDPPPPLPPPVKVAVVESDPTTGKPTMKVAYLPESEKDKPRTFISWSPDGEYLACWWDGRLWYLRAGTKDWRSVSFPSSKQWGCSLDWLPDSSKLIVSHVATERGPAVFLVDLATETSKPIFDQPSFEARVGKVGRDYLNYAVSVPPNGRFFAVEAGDTGSPKHLLRFFDSQGRHLKKCDVTASSYVDMAWSYDGRKAAIRPNGLDELTHQMLLLDTASETLRPVRFRDYPFFAAWSPDGNYVAMLTIKDISEEGCACSWGGTFGIYEPEAREMTRYPALGTIGAMSWSPDSLSIAMEKDGGEEARPGYLFSVVSRSAKRLPEALAGDEELFSLKGWSPDGRYLVGGWRWADRLLDVNQWKVIVRKPDDHWLPGDAKEGDWVSPIGNEGRQFVPYGWIRLGQLTASEDMKGDEKTGYLYDIYLDKFGSGQPSLIATTGGSAAWWPVPSYGQPHEWSLPG